MPKLMIVAKVHGNPCTFFASTYDEAEELRSTIEYVMEGEAGVYELNEYGEYEFLYS